MQRQTATSLSGSKKNSNDHFILKEIDDAVHYQHSDFDC